VSGMAPSRRMMIDHFRTPATRGDPLPERTRRYCIDCGAMLTWNPDSRCCNCQDKYNLENPPDGRYKLKPEHIVEIAETIDETTAGEQALRYGVHYATMCDIRKKIREARNER
jgi:hypothetical protein